MRNEYKIIFKNEISNKNLIDSIKKLGEVVDISLNFNNHEEEVYLLNNLKNLEYFNGKKIVRLNKKKLNNNNNNKKKIKKINNENHYLYFKDIIKNLEDNYNININIEDFKEFYNNINDSFVNKSKSQKPFIQDNLYMLTIIQYYNFINNYVLNIIKNIDFNIFSILNSLNKFIFKNISNFSESVLELDNYIDNLLVKLKSNGKEFVNHTNDLIIKTEQLNSENMNLKQNLDKVVNNYNSQKLLFKDKINELKISNFENFNINFELNKKLNIKKNSSKNLLNRNFNRNELKNFIKKIFYLRKADTKNKYWTFKDFFYNYLKIIYGNDYNNWYNIIYDNIVNFSKVDNYIYIFKTILDNEINENFHDYLIDIIDNLKIIISNKKGRINKKFHNLVEKNLKIKINLENYNWEINDYLFYLLRKLIHNQIISLKIIFDKIKVFDEDFKGYLYIKEFKNFFQYIFKNNSCNYIDIVNKIKYKNKNYINYNVIFELFINNENLYKYIIN